MTRVLLTGVTGFLGSHTAIQLLNEGCEVVGTLRDRRRSGDILRVIGARAPIDKLQLEQADLLDDAVWRPIMDGIDRVLHIASPFPRVLPRKEQDLIRPAVDGTLRVLKAAHLAGVPKVVLTSSTGAVLYGKTGPYRQSAYGEDTWTDVSVRSDTTPYLRSKTIAEKAAWDYVGQDSVDMVLTTICPGVILGPVLETDYGTSANVVRKLLDGSLPALPRLGFDMIDVRCVADLHLRAMRSDLADGQRFLASDDYLTLLQVADILRSAYPGRRIPKYLLPDVIVRMYSLIDPSLRQALVDLGAERKSNSGKARNLLDWEPRSIEEAVLSCAESLIELDLV